MDVTHPPDDAALVAVVSLHVEVTVVSDGEDVRRHFSDLFVGVEADLVGGVDGQQLVRVDGHQDGAGVGLHTGVTGCFHSVQDVVKCGAVEVPLQIQVLYVLWLLPNHTSFIS